MRTDDFNYSLPEALIAQTPVPRGESRLLVLHRDSGETEHRRFADLLRYLEPGDTLVLNDTRVSARRLRATRSSGLPAEVLLLREINDTGWIALVRPGRRIRIGDALCIELDDGSSAQAMVIANTPEGGRALEFATKAIRDRLGSAGVTPLPPYIHLALSDEERYQTVYGKEPGSAAAPTAGLHFTPEMLEQCRANGASIAKVTLHVGIDTFRPVRAADVESHVMHGEHFSISETGADMINSTQKRVIAVGTTTVRTLESAANETGQIRPMQGETRLFITPGYRFKTVQGLLTNFHLPKSTLLMMVSAFAGRENVLRAYREAVHQQYRFYSFGDAMLII
jgi:S-adenosylmethionine:tRNA ribosyltransferase-isomerase